MARGSPRVTTRSQARSHQHHIDDANEDSDESQDRSYYTAGYAHHSPSQNDSRFSSSSFQRSRNDSGGSGNNSYEAQFSSSFLTDSPDKSSNSFTTSNKLYPDLSHELNESGDSSFTRITERKGKNKYSESHTPSPSSSRSRTTPSPYNPSRQSPKGSSSRRTASSTDGGASAYNLMTVFGIVVTFCAVLYLLTASSSTVSAPNESKIGFEYFEDKLKIVRSSFPSQTNRFWATVSASARHVFHQQDPCYPSVILMASHDKNQRLNTCLGRKIAQVFSSSFVVDSHSSSSSSSSIGTDVGSFKHLDSDEQKMRLDEEMQVAFQRDGRKAFVISNVHSLSPRAALLLHGFCDGDNAPYKDVMIILTFQVSDATVFKSVKEVEVFLTDAWSHGLDADKLSPLMSRIANNPVVVMDEDRSVVDNFCS